MQPPSRAATKKRQAMSAQHVSKVVAVSYHVLNLYPDVSTSQHLRPPCTCHGNGPRPDFGGARREGQTNWKSCMKLRPKSFGMKSYVHGSKQ